MSEFMSQLGESLKASRGVADSTVKAYLKTLCILNDKAPFKNLNFLKDIEHIDEKIKEYAPTTQRAILATIISVMTPNKSKATMKKVYDHYYKEMMDRVSAAKDHAKEHPNEKTEKQTKNWISWADICAKHQELGKEAEALAQQKKLSAAEFDKLLQYVILSLYVLVPPRRNQDYLDMYVVKKYSESMPKDKNYLDLATKKFIFHKYKTSKVYGAQQIDIPEPLMNVVTMYLKHHAEYQANKRKNDPIKLLVAADGQPILAINAITRVLNRLFGKKVGVSMLRHSFVTDKYGDLVKEQEADASAMGHSVQEAVQTYIKKD